MEHSEAVARSPSERGDHSRDAVLRARLADDFSTIAPACLPAIETLFDFWVETRDGCRTVLPGLREASVSVLTAVQNELLRRASPLEDVGFELAEIQRHAIDALLDLLGPKQ